MGDENYVTALSIIGTKKVRNPEKYYVYTMRLTCVNNSVSIIYRRYSEIFEMHCAMIEEYRELVTSKPRWLPPLPKGSAIARSNVAKVAETRLELLRDYFAAVMKLDPKYISSDIMTDFFAVNDDDMKFMKDKDETNDDVKNDAATIGGPVTLEEYEAIEDYKPTDKKSVSLAAGEVVEVLDKNNSGWWYISWSGGIGWVPANYLRPVDGGSDDMQPCEGDNFYLTVSAFKASGKDEVTFKKGEIATVVLMSPDGWWYMTVSGKKGIGPAQFLIKVEGQVVMEDLINNPPKVDKKQTAAAKERGLPTRSNSHRRQSTRRVRKSMRSKRPAPNTGSIPDAPPAGDEMVVVEAYQATGPGQISLSEGDKVVVTNKEKDEWWYVWKDRTQGWYPAAFLLDKTAVKGPEKFKVVAEYKAASKEELGAKKNQVVTITDQTSNADWWFGNIGKREGWIPASFLQKV